jgi:cysteinyl-tRNA synthetase
MNFTWEALAGAQTALDRLRKRFLTLPWSLQSLQGEALQRARGQAEIEQEFLEATNDDLNMPKALAVAWKAEDQETLLKFDEVLGLKLAVSGEGLAVRETPEEIRKLLEMREKLRAEKKFSEADKLREEIIARGFKVMDK